MTGFSFDICVIGAGPAGCVTALRLAEMGYNVCILEAKIFPRSHVGICFSDESYSLLEYIGVKEQMEKCAFFLRKTTLVKWFQDEPVFTAQPGFHVDRGKFDQILLHNAISAGAKVIQPARAKSLSPSGDGWKVTYESERKCEEMFARFVVDASGSGSILPGKKIKLAPTLFAMHAILRFKNTPEYDGFIEAAKDSWLWFARLNDMEALVTLFTESKHLLKSGSRQLETHYFEMLRHFTLLRYCKLNLVKGKVVGCDASSRFSSDPVGLNFIRVGDANIKVDPVSSQGVHLAMVSALQAAAVVNTIIRKPVDKSYAIDFYRYRQIERINQFRTKTASVYKQVSRYSSDPFWQNRSGHSITEVLQPELKTILPRELEHVRLSRQASFQSIPVMKDNFITSLPALHHPSLRRPVAFLSGHDIVSLLVDVGRGKSVSDLFDVWTRKISFKLSLEIFTWLWSRSIIVSSENWAP